MLMLHKCVPTQPTPSRYISLRLTIARHGWGTEPDPQQAVTYLSYAASNSAEIESEALSAGLKKGGAAKGELVLAMYELAVSFRNGWGIKKDPVAAKQYYETAANLGDTDAMNEVAWCYLEGFGCKKDKVRHLSNFSCAVRYLDWEAVLNASDDVGLLPIRAASRGIFLLRQSHSIASSFGHHVCRTRLTVT